MVAAGMGNTRGRIAVLAVSALALAGAGCGEERQDADAPSGEFDVQVTDASFPAKQRIAEPTTLKLEVANRGDRAVPNLAVIVETQPGKEGQAPAAFAQDADNPTLADSKRPVWIVDEGPAGGESAYTNTWTVGPLAGGQTRTVEWKVTALQAGRYTVAWRLAPSLEGDVTLAGGRTKGEFVVTIDDAPVPARVDGDGDVVRGEEAGRR
jgi:hypothetical protein